MTPPTDPSPDPLLERVSVPPSATLAETVACIDRGAAQLALVVDGAGRLLGAVTDGDVRRAILAGTTLDAPVTEVMNRSPVTAGPETSDRESLETLRRLRIHQLPIVDGEGRLVGLRLIDDLLGSPSLPNRVFVLAGGRGSRLMPLTAEVPKPLLHVGDRPILDHVIAGCRRAGLRRVTLAVNYMADLVREHVGDGARLGVDVDYIVEDEPRGTAGALSLLDESPPHPMVVMNGDILTSVDLGSLLRYHREHGADATMCVRGYEHVVPFGVVTVDDHRLTAIEEKPALRFFVNAGIYVLSPSVLPLVPASGRFDMTDLFQAALGAGLRTCVFPVREQWLDVGRHDDLALARARAARGV